MSNGFVKLHRRLLEWEWYTAPNHVHVFVHLLIRANHKDLKWRGVKCCRGEMITSADKIAQATGLTRQRVRTVLRNLQETGEITIKSTNHYSLISVLNYETYQCRDYASNQQDNQHSTSKPTSKPTSDQPTLNHKQEGEERKEVKNIYTKEFDAFYESYPRKEGKGTAFKAFQKAKKEGAAVKAIMSGVGISPQLKREAQYIPLPATWLNNRGWEDAPALPTVDRSKVNFHVGGIQ